MIMNEVDPFMDDILKLMQECKALNMKEEYLELKEAFDIDIDKVTQLADSDKYERAIKKIVKALKKSYSKEAIMEILDDSEISKGNLKSKKAKEIIKNMIFNL